MKIEDPAQFLIDEMNRVGGASARVKDGQVLLFKRKYLQGILDKNPADDTIIIHLRREVPS